MEESTLRIGWGRVRGTENVLGITEAPKVPSNAVESSILLVTLPLVGITGKVR